MLQMRDSYGAFNRVIHQVSERDLCAPSELLVDCYRLSGCNGTEASGLRFSQLWNRAPMESTVVPLLGELKECGRSGDIAKVRKLHSEAIEKGLASHTCIWNSLITIYAKCGSLEDSKMVFDELHGQRDVVSFTSFILALANHEENEAALEVFESMQEDGCAPDGRTYNVVLGACLGLVSGSNDSEISHEIRSRWLEKGKAIHSMAVADRCCNIVVKNVLINMYAKFRNMAKAQTIFDNMLEKDVVSWTALLQGYVENSEGQRALKVLEAMKEPETGCDPDAKTYLVALTACTRGNNNLLEEGKAIHSQAVIAGCCNGFVESELVHMYAKSGRMVAARSVFDNMTVQNVVACTTLLHGYLDNGESEQAILVFEKLQEVHRDGRAYVQTLTACAGLAAQQKQLTPSCNRWLEKGKSLHSLAIYNGCCNTFVKNTLVNLYAKCGRLDMARYVFDEMAEHSIISWNCLVQGYVENGENRAALELIAAMDVAGLALSEATFVAALMACGNLMALQVGKAFHLELQSRDLEQDAVLGTCLINFYGKCGKLDEARRVFDLIPQKGVVTWNNLLSAYCNQGDVNHAFELFQEMRKQRIAPDPITFTHLLTTCAQAGLTAIGKEYFELMESEYGIKPDVTHYTCMIDLLSRANRLDEAVQMVDSMPFEGNLVTWTTILAACRTWNNTEVAKRAYEALMRLNVKVHAPYVLMANIYSGGRKS